MYGSKATAPNTADRNTSGTQIQRLEHAGIVPKEWSWGTLFLRLFYITPGSVLRTTVLGVAPFEKRTFEDLSPKVRFS